MINYDDCREGLSWPKAGMSLVELVLAVTILAVSFLPVIGLMGNTIKGSSRDELIVKAIHLGQTRINTALQFPFKSIGGGAPGLYGGGPGQFEVSTNSLVLRLGPVELDDTLKGDPSYKAHGYRAELTIEDETFVSDGVRSYDVMKRVANPTNPGAWGWEPRAPANITGMMQKYTLIVRWTDNEGQARFYSLVAFKVRYLE